MNILESLAGGLRGAAGVLSPTVQQQTFQQDQRQQELTQQEMIRRRNLVAQQIIKAAEIGAMEPEAAKMQLQRLGFGEMPVGPSMEAQARQAALAKEQQFRRELAAATTPEERRAVAMRYASPDKLIQANTERPVSIGRGGALVPDGKGGWTRVEGAPTEQPKSSLSKLIAERDALPPNDPMRGIYDAAIKKQTTQQSAVNVYSTTLTPGIDEQGNPIFAQASGRPGVPPQIVQGIKPPESAADRKTRGEQAQSDATIESVRNRIASMAQIVQQNPTAVGPAGLVRRGVEAAGGVVESLGGPALPTPAIDFKNEQALLLSDVRKIVEKDPNLSNQERERLYETLGGGTFQTPSSAIRAINNVLQYVEGKQLSGRRGGARTAPPPPAVGQVVKGYRFKGGDPSIQDNWEKVN